jgi:hypothetical protein
LKKISINNTHGTGGQVHTQGIENEKKIGEDDKQGHIHKNTKT